MGGGCTCHKNIKKYFFSAADFEIKTPDHKFNLPKKSNNFPQTSIQKIPKSDLENNENFKNNLVQNTDKTKFLSLNKNNISNITDKRRHSLFNVEEEKKNILFNDINNENLSDNSMSSENSKNKDNNILPPNYQINDNNPINNEILGNNNTPSHLINNDRGRTSLVNGVEKVESATPKMNIGKFKSEDKTKGSKKSFSHFFQNK